MYKKRVGTKRDTIECTRVKNYEEYFDLLKFY